MSKPRFTPSPWAVNPLRAQVDAMPSLLPVCQLLWPTDERTEAETEANAHLIKASPDLYEALESLLSDVVLATDDLCDEGDARNYAKSVFQARAALAKARGEQ